MHSTNILFIFTSSVLLKGIKAFKWFFNPAPKNLCVADTTGRSFFHVAGAACFAQFWGRSEAILEREKNWVDLKAVFPQRGHHNLQAFLQGAGHNRIHLFDPTNAPYPSLPAPAHLLPPISLPAFLHPCLSTSAWQEVGRTPPELEEGWATMSPLQQLAKCRLNKCAVVIQPMRLCGEQER